MVNGKKTPQPPGKANDFVENERVLCYEPDYTKVRVIYDAKILKVDWVEVEKEEFLSSPPSSSKKAKKQTKAQPELQQRFLVHFQGWNDKWDRYVPKSYLLKDLPENRAKQQELFQVAEELTKNKKKKKKRRTEEEAGGGGEVNAEPLLDTDSNTSRSVAPSPEPVCSGRPGTPMSSAAASPAPPPPLPLKPSKSRPSESGGGGGIQMVPGEIPVRLPEGLKLCLEQDFNNNNGHGKKQKSAGFNAAKSAGLNIVAVLEDYVRHYANAQLIAYEKQMRKNLYTAHRKETKQHFDKALDSISLAKEVAEGLRIMTDFYLEKNLLYESERKSFKAATHSAKEGFNANNTSSSTSPSKSLRERKRSGKIAACNEDSEAAAAGEAAGTQHGGQQLPESSKADSVVSGNSSVQLPSLLTPPGSAPNTPQSIQVLRSVHDWKLLPEDRVSHQDLAHLPSVLCGPVYLLRLFVKLPEILYKMNMPAKNSKLIVKYMDSVLEYLDAHTDLFA